MDVREAYNEWAGQYDTNENKTRDLEAIALRALLESIPFKTCLEIGCGTGKNTGYLASRANEVMAVDLSDEMLAKARKKVRNPNVIFCQADISNPWDFAGRPFDLISFSLVLEHIEDLDHIFREAARKTASGGYLYLGELHPYKQYLGTKARFETDEGTRIVTCFDHHLTDFSDAACKNGFSILQIGEYFDNNQRRGIPRILAILFKRL